MAYNIQKILHCSGRLLVHGPLHHTLNSQQKFFYCKKIKVQKSYDSCTNNINLFHQSSFRDLWDEELIPGKEINTDEKLLQFIQNNGGTVFHPVGTCRMGNDESSVVNENLQVRGVNNLRVIDASVMPQITSANTNAPSLMIGEKGSSIILNK